MERHTQVQMDVAHLVVLILVAQPLLLVLVGVVPACEFHEQLEGKCSLFCCAVCFPILVFSACFDYGSFHMRMKWLDTGCPCMTVATLRRLLHVARPSA